MEHDEQAAPADAKLEELAPAELDADIQSLRRQLPTLEAVERRRGRLWVIAAVLLTAASAMVYILSIVPDATQFLPDNNALRAGTGVVSAAFLLYVFDQERRMRRLSHALVEERVLSSLLNERVRDLATLSRVGQVVNSVLTTDEVLQIILRGARELTRAVTGSVMLVDRHTEELVVEVATGKHAAPEGARQPLHAGVGGRVAGTREPLLISGEVGDGQVSQRRPRRRIGGSSVIAPMIADDEVIGVISLEREHGDDDFTQWDLRAVSLFANHAATAVRNAQRYESERANVSRLADMIERRSEFVATLVHDLKAPLTSILGYARLLSTGKDGLGPDGQRKAMLRIQLASEDLLDMINEVLRSASFEATEPVRPEPVDLEQFLGDAVEAAQSLATGRDGDPRPMHVQVTETAQVRTDPGALRSVLQNLLENAIKYSPAGSPIEIEAGVRGGALHLAVRDHGRGIAAEDHEVIFERFRRQRPGEQTEGVGLGLYIVRSLVLAQGGAIEVDSTPGEGATFRVTLPEHTTPSPLQPEGTDPALPAPGGGADPTT